MVTRAEFRTICPECLEPVEQGEPIAYSEQHDGWLHDDCADGIRLW